MNTYQIARSVGRPSREHVHMRRTTSPARRASAVTGASSSSTAGVSATGPSSGLVSRSTESPRQPAALRGRGPGRLRADDAARWARTLRSNSAS